MGRNREVLKELGRTSVDDDALVQAGQKVLRDGVKEFLASKGLTEAVGFVITLKNGEEFTILSDENPRMTTPMEQVQNIEVKQSAKAGGLAELFGRALSIAVILSTKDE